MLIDPDALRRIRERKGHTQASLAKATSDKVSQQRIADLEGIPQKGVRPPTAKALADALEVLITDITVSETAEVTS